MRAALTFDTEHPDRPAHPGGTERLLDVLESAAVRATFFVQGRWAEAYPSVARSIATAGHVIGSHSHYHARMTSLTDAGIASDLGLAERAIRRWAGADPRPWFRFPFGDGAADERLLRALTKAGYRHVGWHVDALDWRSGTRSGPLAQAVADGLERVGDGAIVLLHAWPTPTAPAVERIVAKARTRGIELVTVDELPGGPVSSLPW
jgi:peptidoglycan/xylan/chitin deacetylase (PgdA/CDA1 family)